MGVLFYVTFGKESSESYLVDIPIGRVGFTLIDREPLPVESIKQSVCHKQYHRIIWLWDRQVQVSGHYHYEHTSSCYTIDEDVRLVMWYQSHHNDKTQEVFFLLRVNKVSFGNCDNWSQLVYFSLMSILLILGICLTLS